MKYMFHMGNTKCFKANVYRPEYGRYTQIVFAINQEEAMIKLENRLHKNDHVLSVNEFEYDYE